MGKGLIFTILTLCFTAVSTLAESPFGKGTKMFDPGKYTLFGKPVTHPEFEKFIKTLKLGTPGCVQFTDGGEDRYLVKTPDGKTLDVRIGTHKNIGYGSVVEEKP